MANLDAHDADDMIDGARRSARHAGRLHQAQVMLLAAGLAAFGIVAVAATMMTTLF